MPRKVEAEEINKARSRGREKVLSLVSEWPEDMDPNEKQKKLKRLYGEMITPMHRVLENFDPLEYRVRKCDQEHLKLMMLGAFQAVESARTIADLMHDNIVDYTTYTDHEIVDKFANARTADLCEAFYTFVTDARIAAPRKESVFKFEAALSRKGLFPGDLLRGFAIPKWQGA